MNQLLVPTMHSNYPRIGDTQEKQKLRQAITRWEKQEISDDELRLVEDETTQDVVQEQIDAGLKWITDGQIRWYCPFSYISRKVKNVEVGGLLRYFDTNFYFRQPILKGEIEWQEPITARDFAYAASVSSRPVKAVLTGAWTLAHYSIKETEPYVSNSAKAVLDWAKVLAREVIALENEGASWIQFDEPALLHDSPDWDLVREAWEIIASARQKARLALSVFWGKLTPVWDSLLELPVDGITLDLVAGSDLLPVLERDGAPKLLALGLLDGRNTRLEDTAIVLRTLEKILRSLKGESYLTTSCGLELLPRDRAQAKLHHLTRITSEFHGGQL